MSTASKGFNKAAAAQARKDAKVAQTQHKREEEMRKLEGQIEKANKAASKGAASAAAAFDAAAGPEGAGPSHGNKGKNKEQIQDKAKVKDKDKYKTKSKKVKKSAQEDEGGSDEDDSESCAAKPITAEISKANRLDEIGVKELNEDQLRDVENAKVARAALLGYGYACLLGENQLKAHFGKWNQRPLDRASVGALAKSFLEDGASPWRAPMRVLVHRGDVLNGDKLVETQEELMTQAIETPEIIFGVGVKLKTLNFAGGNHRYHAMQGARSALQGELKQASRDASAMEAQFGTQTTLSTPRELVEARARLMALQHRFDQYGKWILEVYIEENISPQVKGGDSGRQKKVETTMRWLSENRRFYELPETVNEKLIRMLRHLGDLSGDEQVTFVKDEFTKAKAFTDRVIKDPETREFLFRVHRVGAQEWEQTKIFRASFLAKHMERGYGMIWRTAVDDMVRLVKFVFSTSACPSVEEQLALTTDIEDDFRLKNVTTTERPVDWATMLQRARDAEQTHKATLAEAEREKKERGVERHKTHQLKKAAALATKSAMTPSGSVPSLSAGKRSRSTKAGSAAPAPGKALTPDSDPPSETSDQEPQKTGVPDEANEEEQASTEEMKEVDEDAEYEPGAPGAPPLTNGQKRKTAVDTKVESRRVKELARGRLVTRLAPTRQLMKWRPQAEHLQQLEIWAGWIDVVDDKDVKDAAGATLVSALPVLRGAWEKLDDTYSDYMWPQRAYLGSMRYINERLDVAADQYYQEILRLIRELQPGELSADELTAWKAVEPGVEARLLLGLQTLKWIRGWLPLPCPTGMGDVGEALAQTPHAIREVARWFDPLIDARMLTSRGLFWDASDAISAYFHFGQNIRNFDNDAHTREAVVRDMYRILLRDRIPGLVFGESFILTERNTGWKRPHNIQGYDDLEPFIGLPVEQYIVDAIPGHLRAQISPTQYYKELSDQVLKTTSKEEMRATSSDIHNGQILRKFPFIYITRQSPAYPGTSNTRVSRRKSTTQYSLVEWAAVLSTRLPLIKQEPIQGLRTLMRDAMSKYAVNKRLPVMTFPDEEAFQSLGLFKSRTGALKGDDSMYVFDTITVSAVVGAYADKCLGEVGQLLSTITRINAGRAVMGAAGRMDGATQRAAMMFIDALTSNVARQVARQRYPPEYAFVSETDPDDMSLYPSHGWPDSVDDDNVVLSTIDLPAEPKNPLGRKREVRESIEAELKHVSDVVDARKIKIEALKAELTLAESQLQHAQRCKKQAQKGVSLQKKGKSPGEAMGAALGLSLSDSDAGEESDSNAPTVNIASASGNGRAPMQIDEHHLRGSLLALGKESTHARLDGAPDATKQPKKGKERVLGSANPSGSGPGPSMELTQELTPPPCAQPRRIVSPKSPVIEQQASRKRDRSSTDASNRSLVTSPGRVPRPHKRQAKEDEFTRHGQDAPQLREDSPDGYIQSSENEIHGTSALLPTALHVGVSLPLRALAVAPTPLTKATAHQRSHRPNRKTPRSTHAPSTEPGGIDKSGTVPVKWKALS